MSGFNNNYFNRHLINDMRNALNSVFIEEEKTSARNLEQFRERQASDRADRIATGKANNAAKDAAKAERAAARTAAEKPAPAPASAPTAPAAAPAAAVRGPNAGKINTDPTNVTMGDNGRPRSINLDGSFNISPEAQVQAAANRTPGPTETPPRERYVNRNSPEGRVEASITAGKEPDLPRAPGNRIITNDRGVQDPDSVGYAAGQRAFDASIAADARASAKAAADARAAADDTEELEDSIPNNGGLLTQLRGAIRGQNNDRQEAGADARAPKPATPAPTAPTAAQTTDTPAPTAPTAPIAARSSPQINTSGIPSRLRNAFERLNQLDAPEAPTAPTAPTTGTPAQPTASSGDTVNGVRQSWQDSPPRPSQNIRQDPNNGRNDVNNFNRIPKPRPFNLVDPSTQRQDERDVQQRDSQFSKSTAPKPAGSTPSVQPPVKYGEGRSNSDKFVPPQNPRSSSGMADNDLRMWNGTIGPNGGQRANPAGSTKSTVKPASTVKPKTPPQTFFPMR